MEKSRFKIWIVIVVFVLLIALAIFMLWPKYHVPDQCKAREKEIVQLMSKNDLAALVNCEPIKISELKTIKNGFGNLYTTLPLKDILETQITQVLLRQKAQSVGIIINDSEVNSLTKVYLASMGYDYDKYYQTLKENGLSRSEVEKIDKSRALIAKYIQSLILKNQSNIGETIKKMESEIKIGAEIKIYLDEK